MAEEFINQDLAQQEYGARKESEFICGWLGKKIGAPCATWVIDVQNEFPEMTNKWCCKKCGTVSDAECWQELFRQIKEEKAHESN
jgi:hypothetical protein